MMDIQEATKILNARSDSILGQTLLYKKLQTTCQPEETKRLQELITALRTEVKKAMVLTILTLEDVVHNSKSLVLGATEELAKLWIAIERSRETTKAATEFTAAHKESSQTDGSQESPSAKAVREFRESRNSSTSKN
jgi:hypothetical protein